MVEQEYNLEQLEEKYGVALIDFDKEETKQFPKIFKEQAYHTLDTLLSVHRADNPLKSNQIFLPQEIYPGSLIILQEPGFLSLMTSDLDNARKLYSKNPMSIEYIIDCVYLTTYNNLVKSREGISNLVNDIIVEITGCEREYLKFGQNFGGYNIVGKMSVKEVKMKFNDEIEKQFGFRVHIDRFNDKLYTIKQDIIEEIASSNKLNKVKKYLEFRKKIVEKVEIEDFR